MIVKRTTQLMGLILALIMLFCIPATAFAAGREELLYPGEIVVLGSYEQDGVKSNGPEDIEWLVLKARDNCALLISRYVLDARPYNSKWADMTWEECTLRSWLNGDFYETVFSDEEQEAILTTEVDNGKGQGNSSWRKNGGSDTEDKVYLLSYTEVREYFDSDKERTCEPTKYALNRGVWRDKTGTSHWWLRSPGQTQNQAAYCSYNGGVSSTQDNNKNIGVRPVIRVDLSALDAASVPADANSENEAVLTEHPDFRIEDGVLFDYLGAGGDITIPSGVMTIGWQAFSGCSSLTSVTIPDSVTSIEGEAFSECENLVNINIPESVTYIGDSAFFGCSSLTHISLPDEISCIGHGTFLYCDNLQTVVLPRSIKHIGMSAFGTCQALESITIPESIKTIGPNAFYGCTHLTEVDLPANIESIGVGAFGWTPWIETKMTEDGFVIVSGNLLEYRGNDSKVIIPEGVTFIGEYAFSEDYGDEHKLTEVTIPGTVKIIDRFSFKGCWKLTSVTIQEGVQSIGVGAFLGCGLRNVNLPKSVQSVGDMAFEETPWFTEMMKKEDIIVSGDVLIKYCGNESEVVIPDSIRTIADEAFSRDDYYDPENLERVAIPEGVLHIGAGAFTGCVNLQSIEIPMSVRDIGRAAFWDTAWFEGQMAEKDYVIANDILIAYIGKKEEAIVPEGVKSVAGGVFYSETLKSVRIPRSVTSVYEDLMGWMSDNDTDVYYDGVLLESWTESRYETSIARYDFPETVTVLHANY